MYAQIQKPSRGKLKNSLELRYIHIHEKDSTGVIEITRDFIENGNGFYGDGSADAARDAVVWKQQVNRQPELIKVDVDFFVGFILLKNGNPGKRIASSMLDGISMLNLTRRGLLSQMTADARDVIFQDLLRNSGLKAGDIEGLLQQKPSVVKVLFDVYPNLEVIVSPNGDFPFRGVSVKREQLYNCAYLRRGLQVDIVNQSGARPVRIIE